MARDWDLRADELSTRAIEQGRPTAWFEQLYAAGEAGEVSLPWDRDDPHPLLSEWTSQQQLAAAGRRGVVVGCGLGADAEHLAALGFDTVGFDVSPTAVRLARSRHPGSAVDYRVADLLDLPPAWSGAFDLVVEVFTVQALPDPPRSAAMRAVSSLVAPAGRLLAIEFRATEEQPAGSGPPFSLTRDDLGAMAGDRLRVVTAEALPGPRWRVAYERP